MNQLFLDIVTENRAQSLFREQIQRINRWTDRFFVGLLMAQWAVAIGLALWISPRTWDGAEWHLHPHVWTAVGLGGLIVLPVSLLLFKNSSAPMRYVVAVAQMLIGALLIHLTNGRIETHFHVFGSLALLAFYRDWKVLVVGSVVVAIDHFLRGTFWPRSIFGVMKADPWRWIEHAGWVVFEDIFLIWSCFRSVTEMQEVAQNQAELEATRARVESTVLERTADVRRGELRYRTLIEATSAIVWDTPESGEFVTDQPGWSGFTGQSLSQLLGWGWLEAVHPDDRPHTAQIWSAAVASRSLYEVKHRVRRYDGEYRHMLGRAVPVLDESDAIVEWSGIHADVDDQTRAIEAMDAARQAAESASRAKGEFLANMSHEIRTPMNGIIGMTELALESDLPPELREYLRVIKNSSEALLDVINDILDFSKIEAGKLDLDPEPFELRACFDETMRVLAQRAHAKGLEISVRIPPEVPDFVVGDAGRLRQILVNLVGNAIKFTEHGEIAVSVDEAEHSQGEGRTTLRVTVRDTGIGIPADKLHSIFEAFEQADGSTTRKYGGTGLGLAISVNLVKLMGGHLSVTSKKGVGSTFSFDACFEVQPSSSGRAKADPEILGGMPILVVDDNPTNRRILEEVLKSWGAIPSSADCGPTALEMMATAKAAGRPFRVILLDGMMPEMDGYAVAKRIASNPNLAAPLVVMLTSNDQPGELARCHSLGIAARLTKPIRQSELYDSLMKFLPTSNLKVVPHCPDIEPVPVVSNGRCYSILVAEDNLVNQKVVTSMLTKRGHRVTVAGDGLQALAARSREQFDLILMDIQMPEMDGFEAVGVIRNEESSGLPRMPIIALTAHAMKGDRERCLESGFDDYVSKPIRSVQLFEAIEGVMAHTSAPEAPEPQPPAPSLKPAFDLATSLECTGGDEDLFREILNLFLDDTTRLLGEIDAAIETDDPARLRRAAHMLKGTAGHFGAEGVVEVAQRLDAAGKSSSCRSSQADHVTLLSELDRFFDALGELAPTVAPWRSSGSEHPSRSILVEVSESRR